ncbi:MAG: DUF1289 domain-containing protein [Paracoccaceae bacterium]
MTGAPTEAPLSPCVNVCVIQPETGLCIGCLRNRDEIAAWARLDNAERRAIMDSLPARAPLLAKRRGGRAGRLARRDDAAR